LKFVVNDADWTKYLKRCAGKSTVMAHRFLRTYIDNEKKRLAMIDIEYYSEAASIEETRRFMARLPRISIRNFKVC